MPISLAITTKAYEVDLIVRSCLVFVFLIRIFPFFSFKRLKLNTSTEFAQDHTNLGKFGRILKQVMRSALEFFLDQLFFGASQNLVFLRLF